MNKKKSQKKEVTLETILEKMEVGFNDVNKKFDMIQREIDNLAISTARGFSSVEANLEDLEEQLTSKIHGINRRIDSMADEKKNIDFRVTRLEKRISLK